MPEAKTAEQPSAQDVHVPALLKKKGPGDVFLKKLYEKMKEVAGETFTQDQFNAAVRYARSHAGGKMKGRKGEATAAAELSYSRLIEMVNAELREEFSNPLTNDCQFYYAQEVYPDHVIVNDYTEGKYYSIPYTVTPDNDVEFGEPAEVEQQFVPLAAKELNIIDLCADGHGWRLFNELQDYAEPPDWIPYLPKPGKYTSPRYGEINITEDRITNFVKNFEDKVYQEKLPIDAEHETKLSGALGWITEMRVNSDGSVDAKAEWTDRGTTLIEADRFKYFSPEWFEEWTDPATEVKHSDIAVGGALTTRPFFKEKALRPLIANEQGLQAGEINSSEKEINVIFTALAPVKEKSMSTATEDKTGAEEATKAAEAQSFAELKAELEAERAARQASEEASLKAGERIANLEKEGRTKRFADTIRDSEGGGTKRFIGDESKHLEFLEKLSTAFGETSDEVKHYVTEQQAHAEQVRASSLFKEVGRTGGGENSAAAQLDAKAKVLHESNPQAYPTYALAYDHVYNSETELRRQYKEERGAK